MIFELRDSRVLVTGASGFIGSNLVRRLIAEGAEVHGVDVKGPNQVQTVVSADSMIFHHVDLLNYGELHEVVRSIKPKKVFHLAAYVDVSRTLDTIDKMVEINIRGTMNLLRALDGTPIDCFVNTGASEEYGDNPAPFREDQPPNPVSPYSASKAATTLFCRMLYKTQGLPTITLRPFLVYGPGQQGNMLIPSLIRKTIMGEEFAMTGGEQTREFNYVDDVVDGFVRAAVAPGAIGEIINIGNGVEHKVRDVVDLVLQLMNSPVKPKFGAMNYRPGENWHFYCDNTKARKILGWEPKISLEDGLRTTISWATEHYCSS